MVSAADIKLVINFDSGDSWVMWQCMTWVTNPIKYYGCVGGCTIPISVVTSFTSFHYLFILTIFTIL